ncbi:MAG: hypothetical protein ACTSPY_08315 [Candidatus Helarchaeota archaeon]
MNTLEDIFNEIIEQLNIKNGIREKIITKSRHIIQNCGKGIKDIHNGKYDNAFQKIQELKELINDLINVIDEDNLDLMYKNNIFVVFQEFTELGVFYYLITEGKFISYNDLNVPISAYLFGLCDVIGELRRFSLDSIRKNDIDTAERILNFIDEIYENLTSLNYPSGLVPNLRHKVDVARLLLERTRANVTMAWVMLSKKEK